MKTWLISDTHCQHWHLTPPKDVELVIHAGDESSSHAPYQNEIECRDFLDWFSKLDIKHKIFIAGNHSAAISEKLVTRKEIEDMGIFFLEHEYLDLEGKRFFGSPYSIGFGSWYFMVRRDKIGKYWDVLEEGIDVLISHGPPRGILDMAGIRGGGVEHCGDAALYKRVQEVKPKWVVFGHIHNNPYGDTNINSGLFFPGNSVTKYCNASVVEDKRIESGVINNGYVIEL